MMKFKGVHLFIGFVILAVFSSVIAGFLTVGSPSAERARKLDQQRVSDLQSISYGVDTYYNQLNSQRLPVSLDELRSSQNVYVGSIVDPTMQTVYEYRPIDALSYQLCATFETDVNTSGAGPRPAFNNGSGFTFWDHPVGYKCFDLKVNATQKPMPPVMEMTP